MKIIIDIPNETNNRVIEEQGIKLANGWYLVTRWVLKEKEINEDSN